MYRDFLADALCKDRYLHLRRMPRSQVELRKKLKCQRAHLLGQDLYQMSESSLQTDCFYRHPKKPNLEMTLTRLEDQRFCSGQSFDMVHLALR